MSNFDDMVDREGLGADEEARLRRVHDLLVQAGPPPDLPPALERPPTAPAAEAQGTNRFQRGQYFFSKAESEAAARGVEFRWALQIVPGVGHSASQMAMPAAELFRYTGAAND